MSLPDRGRRRLVIALGAGLLAGCQVRPLYAPGPFQGDGKRLDKMAAIAIDADSDRVAQVLENELIFALRGGAALADKPLYQLHLIVTTRATDLVIEASADVPTAKLVALTATYTLTEIGSGQVITHGDTFATASFDFSSQRFANLRAQRDAEDRAARTAAGDIRLKLAMALK